MERIFKTIQLPECSRQTEIRMEYFENGGEIVKVCSKRTRTSGFSKCHFEKGYRCDSSFEGVKTVEEALGLLANGWTEKMEPLKKTMKDTQRKSYSMKNGGMKSDIVGFVPIVPNAILGLPNSMLNIDLKPKKNKVINLVYGLTYSAYVDQKDIIKYGMKVMEHVIKLEADGFRVRLTCMQNYGEDNNSLYHLLACKVKSEDQPLDIQRVMFPLFHPAMFRTIGFGWYESLPEAKYICGYGRPLYFNMSEKQMDSLVEQLFGRTAVYVDGMSIEKRGMDYIGNKIRGKEE